VGVRVSVARFVGVKVGLISVKIFCNCGRHRFKHAFILPIFEVCGR